MSAGSADEIGAIMREAIQAKLTNNLSCLYFKWAIKLFGINLNKKQNNQI